MLRKFVFFAFFAFAVCDARSTSGNEINAIPVQEAGRSQESSYFNDFRFMYKVYQECAATDLSSCLKLKLIAAMDRVARAYNEVPLFEGVSFVKQTSAAQEEQVKTEADYEATLPRALAEKEEALNSMIVDKIFKFFESHTLQVKFPSASELQRSLSEEGRGKKKKMGGLLLLPLLFGGALVPLALGALALLAGKALIISKLALVLAAIIGLKKLFSGGHGGHETVHEVHANVGHGSGWGRSYDKETASQMAYNAYTTKSS